MKQHKANIYGRINSDGKLALNMQELYQFTSQWKNHKIILELNVYEPGTSAALRGYYYNYIVPTFRRAIWESGERMTEKQVERKLRELSPIMHLDVFNENTGKYESSLLEVFQLDNSQLIEHIETLKQIGAEEFSIYIEDPGCF